LERSAIASPATWLQGRERIKTDNIRLIHELRMPTRELGRRIVEAGGFDEIDDFAMLLQDEWPALLDAPTSMLATVRERRAEYDNVLTREPQFVFVGQADAPSAILDSHDPSALEPGDILIRRFLRRVNQCGRRNGRSNR
jgi:hypothetical protein